MPIPPELVQPLPRRVRTTGWFKAMVAIFTVLFPGVGLVMLGVTYGISHDKAVLKEKGLPIMAQITELRVERGRSGDLFYHVGYQFQLPSEPYAYFGSGGVGEYRYSRLRLGDDAPVLYEPGRPGNSGLNFDSTLRTSDPYGTMLPVMAALVAMFGGIYAVLMGTMFFSYSREKELLQWGSAAPALIIKQEQVGGRRPSMTATYQFTDAQGKLVTSIQKGLPSEKKLDWPGFREALERVTQNPIALYDPANSDKSMLYRAGFLVCDQP